MYYYFWIVLLYIVYKIKIKSNIAQKYAIQSNPINENAIPHKYLQLNAYRTRAW